MGQRKAKLPALMVSSHQRYTRLLAQLSMKNCMTVLFTRIREEETIPKDLREPLIVTVLRKAAIRLIVKAIEVYPCLPLLGRSSLISLRAVSLPHC